MQAFRICNSHCRVQAAVHFSAGAQKLSGGAQIKNSAVQRLSRQHFAQCMTPGPLTCCASWCAGARVWHDLAKFCLGVGDAMNHVIVQAVSQNHSAHHVMSRAFMG